MIVDLALLNSICDEALVIPEYYLSEFTEYMTVINISGCRPSEPFVYENWFNVDTDTIGFTPLKGNNNRYLLKADLPEVFVKRIELSLPLFIFYRISAFEYWCSHILYRHHLSIAHKAIQLYLFRYRFIRNLKDSGKSDSEIMDTMGWTSSTVLSGYLNNDIISDI